MLLQLSTLLLLTVTETKINFFVDRFQEEFAASQNVNPTAEPQLELPPPSRTVAQTKRRRMNGVEKKKEKLIDTAQSLISMKEEEWEIIGRSLGVQPVSYTHLDVYKRQRQV